MDGKIKLWTIVTNFLRRCFGLSIFFLMVSPLVIFILLSNANPVLGWTPDWSKVKDEPFPLSSALGLINPVLTASDVDDVNAEFVADPFLFQADNKWYMFFEVLNKDRGLGEIGVATSDDGLVWDYSGIVLRENLHLSYPLVFEHNGIYYMIPDISGTTGVWLYEAVEFPFKWKYVTTLVDGRNYADATVFFYNGKWWMFAGEGWFSGKGNCHLFYSDSLLSGWTKHPKSPIVVNDTGKARPGGRSFVFDTNRVVRIAQKDDVIYGQRVRAFEIDTLTETDYREHEISQSPILYESGTGWNAAGMHHFSPWWTGNQWIAAVDGQKNDIWSIGIYISNSDCLLDPRFGQTNLAVGMEYYTDRNYKLTAAPSQYLGMETITTPNEDRNLTTPIGYLSFKMSYDGTVYVAYDSRAISLPGWMNGFIDTGDVLLTSLSSQPSLKVYSRMYDEGDCVNLGPNKSSGFTGGTVSNFIVFYSDGNNGPVECSLDTKFEISQMAIGAYYYTDRNYMITGGIPDWMRGRTLIQTPNDGRNNNAASGYIRFTNPVSWWVYVLFDSRSFSIPSWLNGWEKRPEKITTSLSSQPYLKVYRKMFDAGQCVDLGGNYGPGSSGEVRSNYVVVYGK